MTTSLGVVFVYLGHGRPSGGTGVSFSGATVAKGDTYVSVGAQFPDRNFPAIARRLVTKALRRASAK